jgi:xanthine dehydrogenase YagR molybdenum-binding subunit
MNAISATDSATTAGIGQPIDRVDGPLKVVGRALYCAEFAVPNAAHAVMVQSTIAAGTITAFDLAAAQAMPGVVGIITHQNAMKLSQTKAAQQTVIRPHLQSPKVFYNGQVIALVVADTLEHAQQAAAAVRVSYAPGAAISIMPDQIPTGGGGGTTAAKDFENGREKANTSRGTPEKSFNEAAVRVDATYITPVEHHNPMEPHATIAAWNGNHLTVWSTTQGIAGTRATMAAMFDIDESNVQVNCPYVGGGFGCKGNTWPPAVLAALAAKQLKRPVKLELDRKQMYTSNGYRPRTEQHVRLGATTDGSLVSVMHDGISQMSDPALGAFVEPVAVATRMIYNCESVATTHKTFKVNAGLPTYMRAPGESSGMFALESAMDELAIRLDMDPLELRLKNYAETDRQENKPFSSKKLRDCYTRGADMFGWSRRTPAPRSMRNGRLLVGYGMATATYPANRQPAAARVRLNADGTVLVGSATQDLGTGTYTIMTQVAADAFGLPASRVTALLGDSRLPKAGVSGGSTTAASITPAIQMACEQVRQKLFELAADDAKISSPMRSFQVTNGIVTTPAGARNVTDLLRGANKPYLEAIASVGQGDAKEKHSMHSFGAQFVEVHVDPDLGEIRVARYVGVFDAGRILNPKTGRSQLIGGITYGIGMALLEATETDPHTGRIVNSNLAEYMVPVHPDVPKLEVAFIDDVDPVLNPLGARGIGELPMVGVAPAIANAVFHATGVRVRSLPIRLEDVLT